MSDLPEKDTSMEGTPVYSAAFLRDNPKKRKELLAAPDGTVGKEAAQKVEAAAPLIAAGIKEAKRWNRLHEQATGVTRALAEQLIALRMLFTNKAGHPDMTGVSIEYREAAAQIYIGAGMDDDKARKLKNATRWHTSEVLRETLMGPEFADGDDAVYAALCERYGINQHSAVTRQRANRAAVASAAVPALVVADDDAVGMWTGAVQYAHKALAVPGDADPSSLPPDTRETLRDELTAVRDRADEMLEAFGDV